jgi:dTMP kinase
MSRRGRFIAFEGGEGAGKSTQIRALATFLRRRGVRVVVTREPGGTPSAERVRRLLLTRGGRWSPVAELLLINAARAMHVREVIRPALERGSWVLCDRFTDATLAYQGYGRGVPLPVARGVNRLATGGLTPDRTLVLDLPPQRALHRARRRSATNRFEDETHGFHRRVRRGYRALARREPRRVRWIAASGSRALVSQRLHSAIEDLLPRRARAARRHR